jgi:predicted nucleic acid-binding protein
VPSRARRAVYADATALIGLARIDRLNLLTLLATPIYVTERVWKEVASDPARPGTAALLVQDEGLLAVVEEGDPDAFPSLDEGESTVLTAAAAVRASVIVDERKARSLIDTDPDLRRCIRHATGIIGLLLLAKRRGRIPSVQPLLDQLIRENYGRRFRASKPSITFRVRSSSSRKVRLRSTKLMSAIRREAC